MAHVGAVGDLLCDSQGADIAEVGRDRRILQKLHSRRDFVLDQ